MSVDRFSRVEALAYIAWQPGIDRGFDARSVTIAETDYITNTGFTLHALSVTSKAIFELQACPIGYGFLDLRVDEGRGGRVSIWLFFGFGGA